MRLIRNISIKWKVMIPIVVLAFLLLVTCLQSNIATDRMIAASVKISENLTEITPEVQSLLTEQNNVYNGMKSSNTVKMVIAVIATIVVVVVAIFGVIRPVLAMNRKLKEIISGIESGRGDLTQRVSVGGKDEIGQLSMGINAFIESLQVIMNKVTLSSDKLQAVTENVAGKVSAVNASSADISSIMEELSATMEEISTSITNIRENTENANSKVMVLADAANDLVTYADSMQQRASDLENKAVDNKQSTSTIVSENIAKLEKAIDDSKKVERINALTNDILQISSQTNLLALNASIEAARAGEAGKGFAVVADEIRQLADSSRETADNIQEINGIVIGAVKDLIDSSSIIVKYINETILPDYDGFVESGKQYNHDAVYVNGVVTSFNEMTETVKQLIDGITQTVGNIAVAIEDSTDCVSDVTENANALSEDIKIVDGEMVENRLIANELYSETERFI